MKEKVIYKIFLAVMFIVSVVFPAFAEGPVKVSLEIDKPQVLRGQKQDLYILLSFDVDEVVVDENVVRSPLNIAVVIDRSGSMEEKGKLNYAKKAAVKLVENLHAEDRFALVSYDNHVTVNWPSAPAAAKALIISQINQIKSGGSTNLTGGMMAGVKEILKSGKKDTVSRVILLSDGLANQGITNPIEIRELVRQARRDGVQISTMGLGLSFNEDLMQDIAENSGGGYYYIENPTQLGQIFQQELNSLFTTVAAKVTVTLTLAPSLSQVEFFGYPVRRENGKTIVELENLYGGEHRVLLMRVALPAVKEGEFSVGKLQLAYENVVKKEDRNFEWPLQIQAATDEKQVLAVRNTKVVTESAMIEADYEHAQYVREFEKGNKDKALRDISRLSSRLTVLNKNIDSVLLKKKIEALGLETREMQEAEANVSARSSYLKKSKQRFFSAGKGKRGLSILQVGDNGPQVRRVQEALSKKKLYAGPVDGRFGDELEIVVKKFQRVNSLEVDGVVGPATLRALGLY